MGEIRVDIELFGAFRRYAPDEVVSLRVPADSSVDEVKAALIDALAAGGAAPDAALVAASPLATDSEILPRGARLAHDARLAILPPVSGG
jgi:molybdopterin synthase sulfur carrier subunit